MAFVSPTYRLTDLPSYRLRSRYLFAVEELDLIADLEIVEIIQTQTTLVTGRDFPDVVLEALEGFHRPLVDHGATAQHAGAAGTADPSIEHVESSDHIAAWQLERLTH